MKGRPKSHQALAKAVVYLQPPDADFDTTDKALLDCLVSNSGAIGENCRPGNAALMAATMLKWSAVHVRIEKNIRLGLIERTKVGDGRKNASVYRICYWHPSYPDVGPTGERYSGNGNHPVTPDDSAETIRPEAGNHPANGAKPSGQEHETIRSMDRSTSTPHPHPTNPPSTTNALGDGWFTSKAGTMGEISKTARASVQGLAGEHGQQIIDAVYVRFLGRPLGVDTLKQSPWIWFLKEFAENLEVVKKDAEGKKREEANILRLAKESAEWMRKPAVQVSEMTMTAEDLLKAE